MSHHGIVPARDSVTTTSPISCGVQKLNDIAGVDAAPRTWACRLVLLTAYLTASLLSVAYSATFISILTVNRYKLPFTDIKGFSQNGKYTLGMLPNSAQLRIFQVRTNLVFSL
jgi:hypothetical protein